MRRLWGSLLILCLLVPLLPAQQAEDERPIITVLDFTTESVSQSEMKTIISLLSSSLFQMNAFTVIDTSQRDNILSEIEFSAGGCTDESCMLEIGRLLAAEMIVVGNLSKIGSRYILSSKLLETQTGKTLGTADGIYGDLDAMVDDLLNFGGRLVQSVMSAPAAAGGEPAAEPEPEVAPEVVKPPKPDREPVVIDWKKVGGISLTTVGVAAAGVGGYLMYTAFDLINTAWQDYDTAPSGSDFEDLYTTYTSIRDEKRPAFFNGMYIAGAGVLAGGLGALLLLIPKKDAAVQVSAAIVPLPSAPAVCVSFRY